MTYDPHAILASIDANIVGFLALGGIALIFNYGYFGGAVAAARRDKTFTFPLACATFWFAHDLSFVLAFEKWFNVYDHWYLKLFWVGLLPTMCFEAWYIYQTWLYGREELLPNASRQTYALYILAAVAVGCIGWWSFYAFLDDPIYAYMFGASGFFAPFFVIPLVLRRGHARGQSFLTWVCYVGMQTFWFAGAILFFGPAFRAPEYLALAAASIGGGIVLTLLVKKLTQSANAGAPGIKQKNWHKQHMEKS